MFPCSKPVSESLIASNTDLHFCGVKPTNVHVVYMYNVEHGSGFVTTLYLYQYACPNRGDTHVLLQVN